MTSAEIEAPPVIQVVYQSSQGTQPIPAEDLVPVGLATTGNQFVRTDEGKWRYNLKVSNSTAPGTYTVTMEPGDTYAVTPTCTGSFVIK